MGVLNVTPDSFSDGGQFIRVESAVAHGRAMLGRGARILDVGGESSRPGAQPVSEAEERARVVPVIEGLRRVTEAWITIDTVKPSVAAAAMAAGADGINDITGLRDPEMREVAIASGAAVVIMHMQGTPRTMQERPGYLDVVAEVRAFLQSQVERAVQEGMERERIALDPGIGFGKTLEHNLALLRALPVLVALGQPVLLGVSRKSFLGRVLQLPEAGDRDAATAALSCWARARGVLLHRVHDVQRNEEALRMGEAIAGPLR